MKFDTFLKLFISVLFLLGFSFLVYGSKAESANQFFPLTFAPILLVSAYTLTAICILKVKIK